MNSQCSIKSSIYSWELRTHCVWMKERRKKKTQTEINGAKNCRGCNWIWINSSGRATSASDSTLSMTETVFKNLNHTSAAVKWMSWQCPQTAQSVIVLHWDTENKILWYNFTSTSKPVSSPEDWLLQNKSLCSMKGNLNLLIWHLLDCWISATEFCDFRLSPALTI